MAYVPLHVHSEYSLLDGAIRVKDLCNFAKENNMPAVAITDHGVMYSALELYVEAKERGVKPLIGCEFYVHNDDIHVKNQANNPLYHLVLIAKNIDGYQNLLKLVSIAWCEGFYHKPRINWELLKEYSIKFNVKCLFADFKKDGGYLKSIELSKTYNLYRQNYCGCQFSKR